MYPATNKQAYFAQKPLPVIDPWQYVREQGKKLLSTHAQLKLEWIIFYHTIGGKHALSTAKHFGINPKTLHKWKKRFNERDLSTLEEKSRAPEKTRIRDISDVQRIRIRSLRKNHIRWGKMKLQERYKQIHGEYISSWKIQKVIEEEHLYFNKAEHQRQQRRKKQARKKPKNRIHTLLKEKRVHYLWHVDTIVFTLSEGGYRYLLTAIDDTSKLAYARLYTTHCSKQAADFLKRLHYVTEGEIINLHHDNGSEFQKDFEQACRDLSLPQWYSRVRTPKDNAVLERFNRTIQEEFVTIIDIGLEDIQEFNQKLLDWLIEYNSIRPHQALDYKTPLEYIDTNLLPMSSSHT
ncbi:MAG: integrase core domain-containing protein, partial [Candidatus Levyibacteriota bacterium]